MQILVVSACDYRMETEAQISEASIRRAIHGLPEWRCEFHRIPDDYGRPPYWFKMSLVRGALARAAYVLWIDADAVMLRPPTAEESEEICSTKTLAITQDEGHINAGVMAWRRCDEAFSALNRCVAAYGDPRYAETPWNEQGVLETFLDTLDVHYMDRSTWNAFEHNVGPHSLIRHWANDFDRRRKMKLWQGY